MVKSRRTGEEKQFEMPKTCPVCGANAVREEGEAVIRCIGVECPANCTEEYYILYQKMQWI